MVCDRARACDGCGLGVLLPRLGSVLIERVERIRDVVWLWVCPRAGAAVCAGCGQDLARVRSRDGRWVVDAALGGWRVVIPPAGASVCLPYQRLSGQDVRRAGRRFERALRSVERVAGGDGDCDWCGVGRSRRFRVGCSWGLSPGRNVLLRWVACPIPRSVRWRCWGWTTSRYDVTGARARS